MIRRLARAVAFVLAAAALTGCQVQIAVAVRANADGSGEVVVTATVDKEAAEGAGAFALDDLRQAGWRIDGPRPATGGSVVVRATKPFPTPAGVNAVVGEVGGIGGPFRDFRITRRRSFFQTRTTFRGTVDLTAGLATFGDDDLRTRLGGGAGFGLDPAAVKQATGADLDQLVHFAVTAQLPGSLTSSNAPGKAGDGATWTPALGQRVEMTAAARQLDGASIVYVAVAGMSALLLVTLLAARLVRRRR